MIKESRVDGETESARAPRIFVSGPDLDTPPAADFVAALEARGAEVDRSPRVGDPRFQAWYEAGLPAAAARCDAFVLVPQSWWDSSTWMGLEAEAGQARLRAEPGFRFHAWHPEGIVPDRYAMGMRGYLANAVALPRRLAEAVQTLLETDPGVEPDAPAT